MDLDAKSFRFNILYNFGQSGEVRPFITIGAGHESYCADPLLDQRDTGINAGGGLRWFVGDTVGVRFDLRYVHTNVGGVVNNGQTNYEGTVGILWAFGGGPAPDEDGDGVPDRRDRCPGTPRGATVDENGCPIDSDGDGVFDGIDQCPDTRAGAQVNSVGCEVLFEEGRETLVLEDVNFEFNSAELTELSETRLDGVAGSLKRLASVRVEVGGHTDSVGNDAYNMTLSQRPAESVRNYLIAQGVDGARLVARGYGETAPVADNATDEGRAANRRVELKKID